MLRIIAVLAALAFGGFMIWNGLYDAHEARLSAAWPTADGKVLSHSVTSHHHRRSGDSYEPIVWYAYTVAGNEYKDSRIAWYTETFGNEPAAVHYMNERFPIGSTVRVHYDPNHPHHACLMPGGASRAMISVYAAITMMVVVVLVVLFQVLRGPR